MIRNCDIQSTHKWLNILGHLLMPSVHNNAKIFEKVCKLFHWHFLEDAEVAEAPLGEDAGIVLGVERALEGSESCDI